MEKLLHAMTTLPMLTARELRRLPRAERARFLAAQANGAESLYREQPLILNDCVDAPTCYGQGNDEASN